MIGKKVAQGLLSWKGADLTVNFYVGNVDISTPRDVIKKSIVDQGIDVVELAEIPRRHNRFKSFKLCIRKKDVEKIKDPDFWPEGVVLRRYFRKPNADGDTVLPHVDDGNGA